MQLRLTMILPACLLFLSVWARAQQAPPPNPPGPPPGPGDAIRNILDLSAQQLQQLTDLRNSFQQKTRDLANQIRTLEQKKNDLLQSSNPNPTELGNLLIQEQSLRKQIQDAAKSYHDAALALLTSAQKQKVAQIQEALRLAPQAGPLGAFGLIEGPGPGGGFRGRGFGGGFETFEIMTGPGPFVGGPPSFAPGGPGMGPRP